MFQEKQTDDKGMEIKARPKKKKNDKDKPYVLAVIKVKGENCFINIFYNTSNSIPPHCPSFPFYFLHGLSIHYWYNPQRDAISYFKL